MAATGKAKGESWASSEGVRRSMRSNKGRDTKPELKIRSAAHALGMRYRVNAKPIPGLRRTADMVFTKTHIAVFVDGCFWHGCPEHHTIAKTNAGYWADKFRKNRDRDAETDQALRDAGWTVIRIWEHEPVDSAVKRIHESWTEAKARSTSPLQRKRARPAEGSSR